jgi:phosphohistidine phosphatase
MNLFLLRHADANTPAARDDERRLSEKGREQTRRVAQFCSARELIPARILTSPIVRALETAEIFAAEIGKEKSVETAPFLSAGMRPETALKALATWKEAESVMLVGHEPDFGVLIGFLLGVRTPGRVHVRKASLTLLDVGALRAGGARLEFSIPVKLMS